MGPLGNASVSLGGQIEVERGPSHGMKRRRAVGEEAFGLR